MEKERLFCQSDEVSVQGHKNKAKELECMAQFSHTDFKEKLISSIKFAILEQMLTVHIQ